MILKCTARVSLSGQKLPVDLQWKINVLFSVDGNPPNIILFSTHMKLSAWMMSSQVVLSLQNKTTHENIQTSTQQHLLSSHSKVCIYP